MYKFLYAVLTAVFLLSEFAHAQYPAMYGGAQVGVNAQFGTGAYMGANNSCPVYETAAGSVDANDDVIAAKKERDKLKSEWNQAKRELEAARKNLNRYDSSLKKRLNSTVVSMVEEHITQTLDVAQWTDGCVKTASSGVPGSVAQKAPHKGVSAFCTTNDDKSKNWAWPEFARDGGEVDPILCDQTVPQLVNKSSTTEDRILCQIALKEYGSANLKYTEAANKVAQKEEAYLRAKVEYDGTRDRVKAEIADGSTEGEVCATCPGGRRAVVAPGPSTGQIIGGGLLAALGGYLTYRAGQYVTDQNAQLGWPTSPYWAIGAGYPLMQAGIYGAMGGGVGPGGYGCAGTIGGGPGGAFGYPPYMAGGQPGGGMWMPGMNAMMNPMMAGMGYPYAGGMPGMMGPGMMGPGMMGPGMMGPGMMGPGMMGPGMMGPGMMGPGMMGPGMMNPMMMQQLQMQMAQAQMQQQAMQDYMYRQQTVYGLQQQMYQIQMQIYNVSSGGYYGGGGPSVLPYPGAVYPQTTPYYNPSYCTPGMYCGANGAGSGYTGPGTPVYTPRAGR